MAETNEPGAIQQLYAPDAERVVKECRTTRSLWELEKHGDYWLGPNADVFRYRVMRSNRWHAVLDPYADGIWEGAWGQPDLEPNWQSYLAHDDFDWQNAQRPAINSTSLCIYETHVRGFTNNPNSQVEHPGTYAGLTEKLDYIQSLGCNAIELLPIWHFAETDIPRRAPDGTLLRNFWGYQPLSFFALKQSFSCADSPQGAANEFKQLVRSAHQRGISIILDVVFNHTGQSDSPFALPGWDRLNSSAFYMQADGKPVNATGCGNTFNSASTAGQEMILNSLRHWARHFHVDGFRYDLGATFYRNQQGEPTTHSAVLEAISSCPELSRLHHFFEPWDAAGLNITGRLPASMYHWDDVLRDASRSVVNGYDNNCARLATAFQGTPSRVHFISCHDGFSLHDVVAYNDKHNEANGEDNRDGHNTNYSANYGCEGETDDPAIHLQRLRQMKNLLTLQYLAPGIPLLAAGDESGRTQFGNNNGYCQDNPRGWVDWQRSRKMPQLTQYLRHLIRLRQKFLAEIQCGWRVLQDGDLLHLRGDHLELLFNPQTETRDHQIRTQGLQLLDSSAKGDQGFVRQSQEAGTLHINGRSIRLWLIHESD